MKVLLNSFHLNGHTWSTTCLSLPFPLAPELVNRQPVDFTTDAW